MSKAFGRSLYPNIKKASKYDHGEGPKEFTHMNKSVASTGKSQHPKQVTIAKNGRARGI
jgi:hypothetical protein